MGRLAGLVVLALLVVAGAWWALGDGGGESVSAAPDRAARPELGDIETALTEHDPLDELRTLRITSHERTPALVSEPEVDEVSEEPQFVDLTLEFIRGGFRSTTIELPAVEVVLTRTRDGEVFKLSGEGTDRLRGRIRTGTWLVKATAPDFHHVPARYELRSDGPPHLNTLKLPMWDDGKLPVLVHTPDGEPFTSLADAIDVRPRFFAGVFDARTAYNSRFDPTEVRAPADFTRVKSMWRLELPGGIAGYLRLRDAPPFWVELDAFGAPFDRRFVGIHTRDVRFVYSLEDLHEHLGGVVMTLVDSESGAALDGADSSLKYHLRGRTSKNARERMAARNNESWPDAPVSDGRLELGRLPPGKHTLYLWYYGRTTGREFTVERGEVTDLGRIALTPAPTVTVQVVDESGAPVEAVVELSEFDSSPVPDYLWFSDDRGTDADGSIRIPLPINDVAVRARLGGESPRTGDGARRMSRTALLDVERAPSTLTLVLESATTVHVKGLEGERDLGVVGSGIDDPQVEFFTLTDLDSNLPPTFLAIVEGRPIRLLPGRYVLNSRDLMDPDERQTRARATFEVGDEPLVVKLARQAIEQDSLPGEGEH